MSICECEFTKYKLAGNEEHEPYLVGCYQLQHSRHTNSCFHMAEVWDKTAEQYKLVKQLLNPESEVCECITDIENNDVLNYLNLLAFKIKYPGITSGNKPSPTNVSFIRIFYLSLEFVNKYKVHLDTLCKEF